MTCATFIAFTYC